jgi:transcriptional regulator of nitric oxide reductase
VATSCAHDATSSSPSLVSREMSMERGAILMRGEHEGRVANPARGSNPTRYDPRAGRHSLDELRGIGSVPRRQCTRGEVESPFDGGSYRKDSSALRCSGFHHGARATG